MKHLNSYYANKFPVSLSIVICMDVLRHRSASFLPHHAPMFSHACWSSHTPGIQHNIKLSVVTNNTDLISLTGHTLTEGAQPPICTRSRVSTPCYASFATASQLKLNASQHIFNLPNMFSNSFTPDFWFDRVGILRSPRCYGKRPYQTSQFL